MKDCALICLDFKKRLSLDFGSIVVAILGLVVELVHRSTIWVISPIEAW